MSAKRHPCCPVTPLVSPNHLPHLSKRSLGRTDRLRIHSDRSWSIEIDKLQKAGKTYSESNFFENGAHFQNLSLSRSRATEFSWTSRAHHPNRYISKPTWDGFRTDLTTGGRAVSIFVKIFLEKTHNIFATICPPIVL